jgi:hypothetical protein
MRGVWIVLVAVTVACGSGRDLEDHIAGMPTTAQRTITRSELGWQWPFDPWVGTIGCGDGAAVFRAGGVSYGLNRRALERGFLSADPIRVSKGLGPPSDPVGRLTQEARMKIFAAVRACDRATGSAETAAGASCRQRITDSHGISGSELTRVDAEGMERGWPPLERPLLPLDPVLTEAMKLCAG